MNYYRRFPGDYQRDTGHLTLTEHGAYAVLLDHYFGLEQALPASLDALYRICRAMTRHEQEAVASVAEQFFPLGPDGRRRNARCDEEIRLTAARRQTASENGKHGGRPRTAAQSKPVAKAVANQSGLNHESHSKPTGFTDGNRTGTQKESGSEPKYEAGRKPEKSSPDSRLQTPDPRRQTLAVGVEVSGLGDLSILPGVCNAHTHAREAQPESAGDLWDEAAQAYPKFSGRQDWLSAEHHWRRLVEEGVDPAELLAGVHRYAAYIGAGGVSGPQFVVTPAKFFGAADRMWSQAWEPPPTPSEQREIEALRKLRDRRAAIGLADFRDPLPGETSDAYRVAQDQAWQQLKRTPIDSDAVRDLAARMRLPK